MYSLQKFQWYFIDSYEFYFRWELDKHYCQDVMSIVPYSSGPRLLDIIDTSIFDFIIGKYYVAIETKVLSHL